MHEASEVARWEPEASGVALMIPGDPSKLGPNREIRVSPIPAGRKDGPTAGPLEANGQLTMRHCLNALCRRHTKLIQQTPAVSTGECRRTTECFDGQNPDPISQPALSPPGPARYVGPRDLRV